MDKVYVIKIGGNIIDDASALDDFLNKFTELKGHKVLVHGGGKSATLLAQKLGITPTMENGRRVTDAPMLEVVSRVYAGLNKEIVAKLQSKSCNAIGLCGADLNILPAEKRQHPTIDYGFVGDIKKEAVGVNRLQGILARDIVPIFCALTHDGQGNLLNTNADTIAAVLSMALAPFHRLCLIYCFEKNGVLKDANDDNSWIKSLHYNDFDKLKEHGIISHGMIPKLESAFEASKNGVQVAIKHAENLLEETGTSIYYE